MQMMTTFKLNGDSVCVILIIPLLHDKTHTKKEETYTYTTLKLFSAKK